MSNTTIAVTIRFKVPDNWHDGLRMLWVTPGARLVLVLDADSMIYIDDYALEQLRKARSIELECSRGEIGERCAKALTEALAKPAPVPDDKPVTSLFGGLGGQAVWND